MTTYYVATTGSNSGNGSSSSPWKTISKAMQANLKPGDDVVVRAGTYNEFVRISASGDSSGYITVRAEKPGTVKITPPSDKTYGVHIQGDYVELNGFEIAGAKGAGVTANLTHHVRIINNEVHDNGTHGISVSRSDFVTVQGNVTYGNASKGYYSGISIYHPENITGDTSSKGFRIVVRGNISYDNVTDTGPHSDGNGIIMDDFRSTKSASLPAYLFPSLVENNLVYSNGGKGIQVAWSDYVTVRNNTAWHNGQDLKATGTWRGNLSNMNSSNNVWVNNIAVADLDRHKSNTAIDNTSFKGYTNSNNVWKNNLTYDGRSNDDSVNNNGNPPIKASDGNLLGVNPNFISAPNNFQLKSGSPAIDAGTKAYGYNSTSLDSGTRVGAIDIGAYEAKSSSSSTSTSATLLSTDSVSDTASSSASTHSSVLDGTTKADLLKGTAGDDVLNGYAGNDTLKGGLGDDTLSGGTGKDVLVGGKGADTFIFKSASDAGNGNSGDQIRDFFRAQGDKIDLSGIDAELGTKGDQAFSFIGSKGFSGEAGELRYANGHVTGDLNGDKIADFSIDIVNHHALQATDFIL